MSKITFVILLFIASPVFAQFSYNLRTDIPVSFSDNVWKYPWTGGLNSPQYNTIDLNSDEQEDLMIFDRASSRIYTFLAENESYRYAPEFEPLFPAGLTNWVLLRDFNCDGKKDLFASDPRGVKVYVNTTLPGESLTWRIFNFREDQGFKHLLTQGFSSVINLQVNASDLPAIEDVDQDGDLDILTFRFLGASTVEFHKNMSIENNGNCDSLQFVRVTQRYGDFEECNCGQFVFNGADCPPPTGGREEHQGGKSLLSLDLNGDGLNELLVSEESCDSFTVLENVGSPENAVFRSSGELFPNSSNPAQLFIFPAAYSEDVDFDGKKDLLVAPNVAGNVGSSVNFESSSWYYKNVGSSNIPSYQLQRSDFLQNEMIDLGENAAVAVGDIDNDGDLDMVASNYLSLEQVGFRSTLYFFRNEGTPTSPEFVLVDQDYLSFSRLGLINLKPEFLDINGDSNPDLVFSATDITNGISYIYYLRNTSSGAYDFEFQLRTLFTLSNTFPNNDNFEFFDINQDGLLDLLVGRSTGKLEYYRNVGTSDQVDFVLEDDSFYGLDFDPFRKFPAPLIADFDGDFAEDMLIGDEAGNLLLYPAFLNNLEDPQPPIKKLFRNDFTGDSLARNIGHNLKPTLANFFNADKPSIALGTGSGGIVLLDHADGEIQPVTLFDKVFAVFPNPVRKTETVTVVSKKNMLVALITVTGKTIEKNIAIDANEPTEISMQGLEAGIYALVGNDGSEFFVQRIMVAE